MTFRSAFTIVLAVAAAGVPAGAQHTALLGVDHGAHVRARDRGVERHVLRRRAALAQQAASDDPCRNTGWDDGRYRTCEVREYTLPAGPLTVEAGPSGGVRVEGWDAGDIRVQAIVTTRAANEADAKQIADAIEVQTGGGRVSSTGPSRSSRRES